MSRRPCGGHYIGCSSGAPSSRAEEQVRKVSTLSKQQALLTVLNHLSSTDTSMSWARRRFSCTGQRMGQWARRNCWTNWQGFQTICTPMAASPETLRVSPARKRVSPSAPEPRGLTSNKEHRILYPNSRHVFLTWRIKQGPCRTHSDMDLPPLCHSYSIPVTLAFFVPFQHLS